MLEAPLFAFLGALFLSLGATPVVLRRLRDWSILDIPNARSSHDTPVPRGGGIVIVFTWCVGMSSTWALRFPFPELGILAPDGFVVSATIGMILLAVLGFIDDRRDLNPFLKLVIQGLVASQAVYFSGLRITDFGLPFLGGYDLGELGWLLSVIWLLGFTNIFNFMDGINGLAFTQLIFGGAAFCLMGMATDDYELAICGALAAGAAAGILKFNFPRALLFMGDVGSLPLGYLLALMALRGAYGLAETDVTLMTPVLILWPFLYDGGYTLINRVAHGRNPFRAHRSHLYQRLIILGCSHKSVTLGYGLAMAICSTAGLALPGRGQVLTATILSVVLFISLLYTWIIVRRVRASSTT